MAGRWLKIGTINKNKSEEDCTGETVQVIVVDLIAHLAKDKLERLFWAHVLLPSDRHEAARLLQTKIQASHCVPKPCRRALSGTVERAVVAGKEF